MHNTTNKASHCEVYNKKENRSMLERGKRTFSRPLENMFQSKQSQQLPQTHLPRWIQHEDAAQVGDGCILSLTKPK